MPHPFSFFLRVRLNHDAKARIRLGFRVWFVALACLACATAAAWQSDNGDGTFTNPPVYADYPDPDIIRVGSDFYFATTTFVNVPGVTILHSQALMDREIVSHAIPRFDSREQYDSKYGSVYGSSFF